MRQFMCIATAILSMSHTAFGSKIHCEPGRLETSVDKFQDKLLIGQIESVYFSERDLDLHLTAEVDTGKNAGTIHATDVVEFERDGKDWVRFRTVGDVVVSRPIAHRLRLKKSTGMTKSYRIVVPLRVRLGNISEEAEFSLMDRTALEQKVTLGRRMLMDLTVIDVGQKCLLSRAENPRAL